MLAHAARCAVAENATYGKLQNEKATCVSLLRGALFVAAVLLATHRLAMDAILASVWEQLRENAIFKMDSWEPGLVVTCWIVFSTMWYILDTRVPWFKRYRIQEDDDMSHYVFEGGHRKQEALLYTGTLLAFDFLYPRRKLPLEAPTAWGLLSEVFLCLFFYDLFFFFCHILLHKVPLLYRTVHAKHHTKKVQRMTEALRLSVVEEVVNVGCSVAAVNLVGAHPLSRTVYNIVIVYLIIELHSGYSFPWMLQDIVPWNLWGGSRRHDEHHVTGRVHYQKFFTYLDSLFGTEHPKASRVRT